MEKEVRTTLWVQDGQPRVEASFEDFDGDVEKWKNAFYEIWRYQLTYNFAYEISLIERRCKDNQNKWTVWVSLLVREGFKKNIVETMEELGYGNIKVEEESVGVVELYGVADKVTEPINTVVVE